MKEVIEYEEKFGGILLDPSASSKEPQHSTGPNASASTSKDTFYFSVKNPHACSPHYVEMYYKKSHLVLRYSFFFLIKKDENIYEK